MDVLMKGVDDTMTEGSDKGSCTGSNPMKTKTIFLETMQINKEIEVFRIYRKNSIRITKRTKINKYGLVSPKFLREINVLKNLSKPPKHLRSHPGRKHVIKILDVYEDGGYLYFDMNMADGNLNDLKTKINVFLIKEKILMENSLALQYIHEMGFNHYDLSHNNIAYIEYKPKMFQFILIDFGNVVHKERPLTIELSTFYTMSIEMIEASIILLEFDDMIKNNAEINNEYIKDIRSRLIHRKSDIWSIASLSYYLHTCDLYVENNKNNIDEQYTNLINLDNKTKKINLKFGNKEII
jgi:serine/threonine protein kinase